MQSEPTIRSAIDDQLMQRIDHAVSKFATPEQSSTRARMNLLNDYRLRASEAAARLDRTLANLKARGAAPSMIVGVVIDEVFNEVGHGGADSQS